MRLRLGGWSVNLVQVPSHLTPSHREELADATGRLQGGHHQRLQVRAGCLEYLSRATLRQAQPD